MPISLPWTAPPNLLDSCLVGLDLLHLLVSSTDYILYYFVSKTGPIERIESSPGYRVALEAIDPSNPSILLQNVTTDPNVDYTLAFTVYHETYSDLSDNSSLFVEFGETGAAPLKPEANQTLFYSFNCRGLGPSDHIKLTSYGRNGGQYIIYDLSITASLYVFHASETQKLTKHCY
jgi:hypothetical protein